MYVLQSVDWHRYNLIRNVTIMQKPKLRGQVGIEPTTSRTQSENHATRPLTLLSADMALHILMLLHTCVRNL